MKPGKKKWASLHFNQKIRNALLAYYLTPILLILFASSVFFYTFTKHSLDEELGHRLVSIAISAAYQVKPYQVAALELRDPHSQTYQSLLNRFQTLQKDHSLSHIYLFNSNHESLLDTDPSVSIGQVVERHRFHKAELEKAKNGIPSSSILFEGEEGEFYKSAFIALKDNGRVYGFIGVDASATFFTALKQLGRKLVLFGLACILLIVIVSLLISRKIVAPISHLVESAQRIGEGSFDQPIETQTQNEIGFLAFALEEMRKNIISRDRELQTMLRGIAHEVRNPLGGIELFAGMLEESAHDDEERNAVDKIKTEVRTLKNLIEEFLDFARGTTLQPSEVDLQEFFEDVRVAFHSEMETQGVRFSLNLNNLQTLPFDADQMRRVFLNLLRNSIQAMPKGGAVEIRVMATNGQAELAISDTGSGIPPESLEKVFDPFFTTKEKGTGLGLSFARKIVNAHGGTVRLESEAHQGTTITITLPR